MTPRKSPPHGGPSPIAAAKQDQNHLTATARARVKALAFNLSATAEGKWGPATGPLLEALVDQAWAAVWDLELVMS